MYDRLPNFQFMAFYNELHLGKVILKSSVTCA